MPEVRASEEARGDDAREREPSSIASSLPVSSSGSSGDSVALSSIIPSEAHSPRLTGALSSEHLVSGVRLGRHELLVPVAKGGMARVWAARQHGCRGFSKLVAIKTILPHLARDPEFERMFIDEARIASRVAHPNVCPIYEFGEEGAVLYLAMEWVNGESLSRLLRGGPPDSGAQPDPSRPRNPLPPRLAARIVSEVCGGLAAAHELTDDFGKPMGVVHRDVSPHNVLVGLDGTVKVTDFGVAKALGQLHDTAAGQLKGKLAYMAPEQVAGTGVDGRSDLFSLGCVLYEATTGVQPFRGEGDHQVMHRLMKGEVVPPSSLIEGFPPELEAIILRALDPSPERRFQTALQMRAALETWIVGSGPLLLPEAVGAEVEARAKATLLARRDKIRMALRSSESADAAEFEARATESVRQRSVPPPLNQRTEKAVRPAEIPARSEVLEIPEAPASASIVDDDPTFIAETEMEEPMLMFERQSRDPSAPLAEPIPLIEPLYATPPAITLRHVAGDGVVPSSRTRRRLAWRDWLGHYGVAALLGVLVASLFSGVGLLVVDRVTDRPRSQPASVATTHGAEIVVDSHAPRDTDRASLPKIDAGGPARDSISEVDGVKSDRLGAEKTSAAEMPKAPPASSAAAGPRPRELKRQNTKANPASAGARAAPTAETRADTLPANPY